MLSTTMSLHSSCTTNSPLISTEESTLQTREGRGLQGQHDYKGATLIPKEHPARHRDYKDKCGRHAASVSEDHRTAERKLNYRPSDRCKSRKSSRGGGGGRREMTEGGGGGEGVGGGGGKPSRKIARSGQGYLLFRQVRASFVGVNEGLDLSFLTPLRLQAEGGGGLLANNHDKPCEPREARKIVQEQTSRKNLWPGEMKAIHDPAISLTPFPR